MLHAIEWWNGMHYEDGEDGYIGVFETKELAISYLLSIGFKSEKDGSYERGGECAWINELEINKPFHRHFKED